MIQELPMSSSSNSRPENATVVRTIMSPLAKATTPSPKNATRSNNGMMVSSFSNMANQAISRGKYRDALTYYQRALDDYLLDSPTVVQLVNAAATCFNLGALSKKLQDYPEAAKYFRQAENLYRSCFQRVFREAVPQVDEQSTSSCKVCLIQLIVETLQARAHLHYKYQQMLDEAIECHEEVVEILDQDSIYKEEKSAVRFKIHFEALAQEQKYELLITSLQFLGKFYVEKSDFEDGLVAYQEVLKILKEHQDLDSEKTQQRLEETTQIVKALSEINTKSSSSSNSSNVMSEATEMQRLALEQEGLENWDKALLYWERVLRYQSQDFGEDSFEVAVALCEVARVMIEQGNYEGSLDLYQAACSKYQKAETMIPIDLISNTVQVFQHLEQPLEGIEWLEEIFHQSQSDEEQAWIQYELGRLYLDQGQLYESSNALCKSAELSEGDDEHVFKLLQKVEFLQNRLDLNTPAIAASLALDAINEGDETSVLTDERKAASITSLGFGPRSSSPSYLGDYDGEEKKVDLDEISNPLTEVKEVSEEKEANGDDGSVNESSSSSDKVSTGLSAQPEVVSQPVQHVLNLTSSMTVSEVVNLLSFENSSEILDANNTSNIGVEDGEENKSSRSLSPISKRDDATDSLLLSSPGLETSPFDEEVSFAAENEGENGSSALSEILGNSSADRGSSSLPSTGGAPNSTEIAQPISTALDGSSSSPAREWPVPSLSASASIPRNSDSPKNGELERERNGSEVRVTEIDSLESALRSSSMNSEVGEKDEHETSSKPQSDVDFLETEHSPEENSAPVFFEKRDSPSPAGSTTSRTRLLLNTDEKTPMASNQKGIRMPSLSSPKNGPTPKSQSPKNPKNPITRIKQEYAEIPQTSKGAPRRSFVNVLASPFRRSRSKTKSGSGLDALDEAKEVKPKMPNNDVFEDLSVCENAPVHFIFDDDDQSQVSQITFRMEDYSSKKSRKRRQDDQDNDGQWWWGVTSEGLEGWFPSNYVTQAVQAAEGFLSAKAIHDRAKSRPLDFDSDDESEVDEASRVMSHEQSEARQSDNPERSISKPEVLSSSQARELSAETSAARPSMTERSTSAGVNTSNHSDGSKKQSVGSKIQEKQELLEMQISENGPEHISVATTLFDLAVLNSKNNGVVQALDNTQRALKVQKSTLNLSDACRSLHFMAELHLRQKQYPAALKCYEESQRLQEAVFGYFHEETANTLNQIGNVFARQGEFGLAMENHKEALRILKECCGEDVKNPLVSQTLIQIGAVYYRERNSLATIQSNVDGYATFIEGGMLEVIGRAHEERGSYRMALAFFEEKLQFLNENEDSGDLEQVAETLNSLGMLSCRAGLYLEAIDYYDRALGIQMKLGCDEVQLAMARVLAGSVQFSLGNFKKALKLFEDALDTLRSQVGSEQETVAATLFHLGVVRKTLCEYDDAMACFRDALNVQKKLLGSDHPATLRTRREIGNVLAVYESELKSASEDFHEILATQRRIHGEKHPNVAETLHSIGCAQAKGGDHAAALRTLEDCYNMRLEFLGMDHPLQAATLHEIAKIQMKRGRLKKAIHICDAALNIRLESLGEQHIDVAIAMATKASCLVAQNNFTEANKLFQEAVKISEGAVGPIHPSVASIYEQIGVMHLRKCHFDEASEAIKKALSIYRQSNLDEDHPGIQGALKDLERVERAEMLCV